MDKADSNVGAAGTMTPFAGIPDARTLLGSWDELSSQFGTLSTAWSREALSGCLRLFSQSAASTSQCLQSLDQGARHLSDMARLTEHRLGVAEDVAGVWNLELGLMGEAAQTVASLSQDAFLAAAKTQTGLMQEALTQSAQTVEQMLQSGKRDTSPAAPDVPALPFAAPQWSAWAETASQGWQAWWNAMAATAAAAAQVPAAEAANGDERAVLRQRAGKRSR
jgi:hypothetical protein